jgi:hypothetical protein
VRPAYRPVGSSLIAVLPGHRSVCGAGKLSHVSVLITARPHWGQSRPLNLARTSGFAPSNLSSAQLSDGNMGALTLSPTALRRASCCFRLQLEVKEGESEAYYRQRMLTTCAANFQAVMDTVHGVLLQLACWKTWTTLEQTLAMRVRRCASVSSSVQMLRRGQALHGRQRKAVHIRMYMDAAPAFDESLTHIVATTLVWWQCWRHQTPRVRSFVLPR